MPQAWPDLLPERLLVRVPAPPVEELAWEAAEGIQSARFDPAVVSAKALFGGRVQLERFADQGTHRRTVVYRLEPAPGQEWIDVIEALPAGSEILGFDQIGALHDDDDDTVPISELVPNDELFADQTSLNSEAGIGVLRAWERGFASDEIVIAVIDAGVSSTHPDLVDVLVPGFNTTNNTTETDDGSSSHGTHVAGIAAAGTDNGIGIAGVARGARVMPLKAFYSQGFGLESDVAEAIDFAIQAEVDVICMSFGFSNATLLQSKVVEAYEAGIVMVASTGNSPGAQIGFPARYSVVLGVGASTRAGGLWQNTTVGSQMLVLAPGDRVLSTWDTPTDPHSYREDSGTSMAAPHVAGVAGLMLAAEPDITPDEVFLGILRSAKPLGDAAEGASVTGARLLNAAGAVSRAGQIVANRGCLGDFNGDGYLDNGDILSFVQAFASKDHTADMTLPWGVIDDADLDKFVELTLNRCGQLQ